MEVAILGVVLFTIWTQKVLLGQDLFQKPKKKDEVDKLTDALNAYLKKLDKKG